MHFPPDFAFTQSNLQDYMDCPRRFRLRYVEKLQWPAIQSEPVIAFEKRLESGQRFHQLVHQYTLGMPANLLRSQVIDEPDLLRWWDNFYEYRPLDGLPQERRSEFHITLPYAENRLSAIIDMIAWNDSTAFTIIDWKSAAKRPSRLFLQSRIQSDLYPFIVERLSRLQESSTPSKLVHIKFIYWFPEFPANPELFIYSENRDKEFSQHLNHIVKAIKESKLADFTMTEDTRLCKFCSYRSFCNRGVLPGNFSDTAEYLDGYLPDDEPWVVDSPDSP